MSLITLIFWINAGFATDLQVKYEDSMGTEWMEILPESFANGCKLTEVDFEKQVDCAKSTIDDTSKAFAACEDAGYALPTKEHWENLIADLQPNGRHPLGWSLKESGAKKFRKIFGASAGPLFASRTVIEDDLLEDSQAYAFNVDLRADEVRESYRLGTIDRDSAVFSAVSRAEAVAVICIRPIVR